MENTKAITQLDEYLSDLVKLGNRSQLTASNYRKDALKMLDFFKVSDFSELDKLSVSDYMSFYRVRGGELKESSLNGLIANLNAIMKAMVMRGIISRDNKFFETMVGGGTKFVKVPDKEVEILTDEELQKLIQSARTIQDRFMICLMAYQGLRRGTIVKIKLTDISGCYITLHGKGDVHRQVKMHEDVCQMLNEYLQERNTDSEYLFYAQRGEGGNGGMLTGVSVNNRVKSAGKLAGFSDEKVENLHAHLLRHTFGTKMVRDYGLDVAQEALWHKSSNTTQRYNHNGTFLSNRAISDQKSLFNKEN